MIFRDFLAISFENLWRMKLRTALTVSGVIIGIGALVAMLSFGFGVQKNVSAQFRELDLFRTMQVLPGSPENDSTLTRPLPLDEAALEEIASIDGVRMVYPQQTFDAETRWGERSEEARVQALPASFFKQRPFGELIAGEVFVSDSAFEAVVSRAWCDRVEIEPDSILGTTLELKAASGTEILVGLAQRYLQRMGIPTSIGEIGARLAERFLARSRPNELAVTVIGVAEIESGFGLRMGQILVPSGIARGIDALSFSDPFELMTLLNEPPEEGWPMLVVALESERDYGPVLAKVEEMGYDTFSFLEQFDEMRKGFLIFDAIIGIIGVIALFVAALGIVNTMVMSIVERTREIGILKALGAEEGQIRLLFLVESGAIGLIGSIGGLLLGYAVSRIISFLSQQWMIRQEVPPLDMFALPVWVCFAAIAFGILISVVAGLYPSARAARVDPVEALRHD